MGTKGDLKGPGWAIRVWELPVEGKRGREEEEEEDEKPAAGQIKGVETMWRGAKQGGASGSMSNIIIHRDETCLGITFREGCDVSRGT